MSTGESLARARAARFEAASRRRLDEARCAWEFLCRGEPHDDCIFEERGEPPCSRDYDPGPPPADEKLYAGSALMALWDSEPNPHAWQLAGWNITRKETA